MQNQGPIRLPPFNEPEPDGAILRGTPRDYADRLPGPDDTLVVFEVADASLVYDRRRKLSVYARAGIPQYVIVNLQDDVLELHERPVAAEGTYESTTIVRRGETLRLALGGSAVLEVDAARLLP